MCAGRGQRSLLGVFLCCSPCSCICLLSWDHVSRWVPKGHMTISTFPMLVHCAWHFTRVLGIRTEVFVLVKQGLHDWQPSPLSNRSYRLRENVPNSSWTGHNTSKPNRGCVRQMGTQTHGCSLFPASCWAAESHHSSATSESKGEEAKTMLRNKPFNRENPPEPSQAKWNRLKSVDCKM